MKRSSAVSESPISRRNSSWSAGSSPAISASRLADSVMPPAPMPASDDRSASGNASAASSSSRFTTTMSGMSVSSECPRSSVRSSSDRGSRRSGRSDSSASRMRSKAATSGPRRASLRARSSQRSTKTRSARRHSAWNASSSAAGSGARSRAGLSKSRSTRQRASWSRTRWSAAVESPRRSESCSPGMSQKTTLAKVVFPGRWMAERRSSRGSGTLTTARRTSPPYPTGASWPVMALNTVVLPEPGKPTSPTFTPSRSCFPSRRHPPAFVHAADAPSVDAPYPSNERRLPSGPRMLPTRDE